MHFLSIKHLPVFSMNGDVSGPSPRDLAHVKLTQLASNPLADKSFMDKLSKSTGYTK